MSKELNELLEFAGRNFKPKITGDFLMWDDGEGMVYTNDEIIEQFKQEQSPQPVSAVPDEKELFYWAAALFEQPEIGSTVTVQYKSFDLDQIKYTKDKKEWFIKNVQCWLKLFKQEQSQQHISAEGDVYSREDVIKIIDEVLECGDSVYDAVTNEHTDVNGESLLEIVEEYRSRRGEKIHSTPTNPEHI